MLFKVEVHALMSSKGLIAALITFMPLIRLLYVVCVTKGLIGLTEIVMQ